MTVSTDNPPPKTVKRVWSALLTNDAYLPGLLTLVFALRKTATKYPFVLFYTSGLGQNAHDEIAKLGIYSIELQKLAPKQLSSLNGDERFHETWTKIEIYGLTQFDRIAVLDVDMAVIQNIDELLSDDKALPLSEEVPLAACHACTCNPYHKSQYPKTWVPENCAYTQFTDSQEGILGAPSSFGVGMINGGLTVIRPSQAIYDRLMLLMSDEQKTSSYNFPDQELISDALKGQWIGLSYKYNALKTLKNIHTSVWNDSTVKNIHYIIAPKPWNVIDEPQREDYDDTRTFHHWFTLEEERLQSLKQ